jgi:Na+-driven multidrug efflux pump
MPEGLIRLEPICRRSVFKLDELGSEVLRIAVPASLALAADPLASLVDTAFIGRLGN